MPPCGINGIEPIVMGSDSSFDIDMPLIATFNVTKYWMSMILHNPAWSDEVQTRLVKKYQSILKNTKNTFFF
jgi:hypothetical protein